jgi:hypothetical protein
MFFLTLRRNTEAANLMQPLQLSFELIEPSNVDYWIFGHSHEVVPDFKIGKTTSTTNQLRCVEYGKYHAFSNHRLLAF